MSIPLIQPTFTGGELSPSLYARVDIERYGNSLKTAKNFIVRPYGGVVNRPGFQFINEAKPVTADAWDVGTSYLAGEQVAYGGLSYEALIDTVGQTPNVYPRTWRQLDMYGRVRLIPFTFSQSVAYVIELGDFYMRFYRDGALVLTDPADAYEEPSVATYAVDDYVFSNNNAYRAINANTDHPPENYAGVDWEYHGVPVAWKSYAAYVLDALAIYDGVYYRNLVGGSGGHQPDISPTYWEAVTPTDWRNSEPIYAVDDFIVYDGGVYQALTQNVGAQPDISPSDWTLIDASPAAWDIATAYVADDVATYNSVVYQCLQATTGDQPDTSPTYWMLVRTWLAPRTYLVGEYVEYAGIIYQATADNTLHRPDLYPADWTANPVMELATPYPETDIQEVRFTQSADVLYLAHQDYAPLALSRSAPGTFSLDDFQTKDGPFLSINANDAITVTSDAVSGAVTLTANADIFTPVNVGAPFYIETKSLGNLLPWTQGDRSVAAGSRRRSDGKTYVATTVPSGSDWTETGSFQPVHDEGRAWDGPGDERTNGPQTWNVGIEWEYQDSGYGVVQITEYLTPRTVSGLVLRQLPIEVVGGTGSPTLTWTAVGDGTTTLFSITGANSPSKADYTVTIDGELVPSDFDYGSGLFSGITKKLIKAQGWRIDDAADTITFIKAPDNGASIYIEQNNASENHTTDIWAYSAWGGDQGFPSEVEFFDERLIFAATPQRPQTLWFSKAGNYTDFGKSTPIVDDDAITATINARQVNAIQDLVPLNNLVLLTTGAEWKTTAGRDDVLSPSSVAFKPQSCNGSSSVPSLVVQNSAVFVQDRGYLVRDLGYQFSVDGYTGNDLTVFATHLTEGKPIKEWAYQKVPFSVIWIVREDGVLLALTYMKEQNVIAWTPMEVDGDVESICVVPGDTEDSVHVVIKRKIGNLYHRYIERLSTRLITDIRRSTFLDSFLSYDGTELNVSVSAAGVSWHVGDSVLVTASTSGIFSAGDVGDMVVLGYEAGFNARLSIIAYIDSSSVTCQIETPVDESLQYVSVSDWGFARDVMSGLDHLEGKSVGVLVDGNVEDERTVVGGSITLDEPGVRVTAGLSYVSDFSTLPINIPGQATLRLRRTNINRVGLIVQDSRAIFAGPDADHLDELQDETRTEYVSPAPLISGTQEVWISGSWVKDGTVFVRQSDPLPLAILGVVLDASVGQ